MRAGSDSPVRRTAALFLGHLVNDGFASFFAPLLPLLIAKLDLSLTLAGALGTLRIATNSLLQPGLGLLVDRSERPGLVVIGPVLTVIAMSFIGRVGSSSELLLIMIAAGIGTALFHPAAASLVAGGTPSRRGLLMAFFSSGGTLGGAVAPVFIVSFVDRLSMTGTPLLLIPGLILLVGFSLLLHHALPPPTKKAKEGSLLPRIPHRLLTLWFAIVLSSACSIGFANFLAVLVAARGGSTLAGGGAISLFLLAGAAAGFFAGNLSDRLGRKPVIFGSLLLATPFYLGFLHSPVSLSLPLIALAGVFGLSSIPVGVVAAQESIPGRTGLVSGLVMGLAWGFGGLALTPIGWLADRFGIIPVMNGVSLLPLIAAGLILAWRAEGEAV